MKLIDYLSTGEGNEIKKSKVRDHGSLDPLCHRSEIKVGAATTELVSLNEMGKMRFLYGTGLVSAVNCPRSDRHAKKFHCTKAKDVNIKTKKMIY